MTDTELEQRLVRDLARAAQASPESVLVVRRVMETAQQRQTPRRLILVAVVACVAGAVGVALLANGGDDVSRTPAPPPVTGPLRPGPAGVEEVLAAMPLGAAPTKPFVAAGVLHDGAERVRLPGTGGGVVNRVDGGWLVLVEHDRTERGGVFTSEFGVLDAAGGFRPLPHPRVSAQEAVISPDGSQIFHGSVVDLASGQVVGSPDVRPTLSTGWNAAGIVYQGAPYGNGPSYFWVPGEPAARLAVDVLMVARNSDRALVFGPDRDCMSVVELLSGGATSEVARWCGQPVYELSPTGRYVLQDGPVATTVEGGNQVRFQDVVGLPTRSPGWEDETHVLYPVETSDRTVQPVRCDVTTGSCERAGEPVSLTTRDDVSFSAVSGER